MTGVAIEPSAAHRAALALHALAQADRDWVLEALSREERTRLHPLLSELEELGIPRDGTLLETLSPGGAQAPVRQRHALEDLSDAGVRRLAHVLAGEPPHLIGLLVACRPWTWRDPLLACLPHGVAGQLESTTMRAPAGMLQEAVIDAVSRALQESPAETEPASKWKVLQALGRGFRRKR